MTEQQWIKPPVEIRYAEELKALKENDTGPRPLNWQLSPKAVRTFILGSSKEIPYSGGACRIRKKYFGNDALVERSIVTLAGNRGLMLVGEPGTAKTMLSELLSAAISGVSTGNSRNHRRYDQVFMELCAAAGKGAGARGSGAVAFVYGHGKGNPYPL